MELIPVFHGIIFHGLLEFFPHLVEYSDILSGTQRNGMEWTSSKHVDRASGHMYVCTTPLNGCMYIHSHYGTLKFTLSHMNFVLVETC